MSFVSYAQNFEDVMLWRALKHIEKGLYVDVGAQHPVIDSVSKAFYERGWRGIHIEPVPQYAELLRKDRPDETVLEIALADLDGTLDLSLIPDTGLSTFVDAYAQRHKAEKGYEYRRIQVPVLTLNSALRFLAGKDVH
jgi:FkbM family methyltransferase